MSESKTSSIDASAFTNDVTVPTRPMQLADFSLLRKHTKNPLALDQAINDVIDGIANDGIRNAVLTDCKFYIGSAVRTAWEQHVAQPYFYRKSGTLAPELTALDESLTVSNLHDVLAAAKKVTATKAVGPAVEAMREFMAEVHPLALSVAPLKVKLIMGRAPRDVAPADANPNKLIKTCACCFRAVAVVRTLMAHHGYTRPGFGTQTQSCYGVRFQPLEVSPDGLAFVLQITRADFEDTAEALQKLPQQNTVIVLRRNEHSNEVLVTLNRGELGFDEETASLQSKLKYRMERLKREIKKLEPMLANWKQVDFPNATEHEHAEVSSSRSSYPAPRCT